MINEKAPTIFVCTTKVFMIYNVIENYVGAL
jgi:hypothetical protein